jgi:hypothetical protein
MRTIVGILTVTVVAAGWAGAAKIDISKLPPPASKQGVTYAADIKPLLDASCIRCHGGDKPKGGLRLESLEGVLKGAKEGKVVVVGDSTKSLIVLATSQLDPESAMPPKPRPGRGPGGPGGPGGGWNHGTNAPAGAVPEGGPGGPGGPGHQMGPPPKPLTPQQVGLLRAWIDQGAK